MELLHGMWLLNVKWDTNITERENVELRQDTELSGDIGEYGLRERLNQVSGSLRLLQQKAERQKDMGLLNVVVKLIGNLEMLNRALKRRTRESIKQF